MNHPARNPLEEVEWTCTGGTSMHRTIILAALGLALVAGCAPSTRTDKGVTTASEGPPPLGFKETTESQHAVFLTHVAPFAGGPAAGAVYLAPGENRRVSVNGRSVLISHAAHRDLVARLPRPQPKDTMFLLVEARVRLESQSGTVTTDPPMSQSFLGVVFEDIKRVEWYTPPQKSP
jgi:hypothetical protein